MVLDGASSGLWFDGWKRPIADPALRFAVCRVRLRPSHTGLLWNNRARTLARPFAFAPWEGRSPPPFGRYADCDRECEVAAPGTWLLQTGWRRIGLIDPAEVPGGGTQRRGTRRAR